jgi:hypothetical protein
VALSPLFFGSRQREDSRCWAPLRIFHRQASVSFQSIRALAGLSIFRSRTHTCAPVLTNLGDILQRGDR